MIYEITFLLIYEIIIQNPHVLFNYQLTLMALPFTINTQRRFKDCSLRMRFLFFCAASIIFYDEDVVSYFFFPQNKEH